MLSKEELKDLYDGRASAFDKAKRDKAYSIFISCFKNDFNDNIVLAEFKHLDNAKTIKDELIKEYEYKYSDEDSYTIPFQVMIDDDRDQAKGPYFLLLVETLRIPL